MYRTFMKKYERMRDNVQHMSPEILEGHIDNGYAVDAYYDRMGTYSFWTGLLSFLIAGICAVIAVINTDSTNMTFDTISAQPVFVIGMITACMFIASFALLIIKEKYLFTKEKNNQLFIAIARLENEYQKRLAFEQACLNHITGNASKHESNTLFASTNGKKHVTAHIIASADPDDGGAFADEVLQHMQEADDQFTDQLIKKVVDFWKEHIEPQQHDFNFAEKIMRLDDVMYEAVCVALLENKDAVLQYENGVPNEMLGEILEECDIPLYLITKNLMTKTSKTETVCLINGDSHDLPRPRLDG